MAAFAPIILADGATTPVNHTFSPVAIDSTGVAKLADRVSGIAVGFPQLTLSIRQPTKASRNYKITGKIVVPTLEVTAPSTATGIQPAPTKAYDHFGEFSFVCPERGTAAERANVLAYMKNLLLNAVVTTAVGNFEAIY